MLARRVTFDAVWTIATGKVADGHGLRDMSITRMRAQRDVDLHIHCPWSPADASDCVSSF